MVIAPRDRNWPLLGGSFTISGLDVLWVRGPDLEHTVDQLLEAITGHAGGKLNEDLAILIRGLGDKFLTRAVRR